MALPLMRMQLCFVLADLVAVSAVDVDGAKARWQG